MEQSDHMTPRVFSFMWMVSHPGSLVKQFIHSTSDIFLMQMVLKSWIDSGAVLLNVNEDGILSWVNLLFVVDGVPSWLIFLLWMVSHPGQSSCCGWCPILVMAPQIIEREGWVFSYCSFFNLVPWQSWSWHQNYEEGRTSEIAWGDPGDLMPISLFLNS